MMPIKKIELSWDSIDSLVVDALKDTMEAIQRGGNQPERDRKLIAAFRLILKYYSKPGYDN